MPYYCLYFNKGNNSNVKGSILTNLIGYQESMVLIICTKNELNLTNRYLDMVLDRQKVWRDGRTKWTDARTTPKLYPSDFVSRYRVPTRQGKVREIWFFFKVREKSGNSVKWSGKLENLQKSGKSQGILKSCFVNPLLNWTNRYEMMSSLVLG